MDNGTSGGNQSQNNQGLTNNPSEPALTKSNIGAQSMQKLTNVASRKVLSPTNEFAHEIVVSPSLFLGLISDVTPIETGKQNGRARDKNCDSGAVDYLEDSRTIVAEFALRATNQRT